MSQMKLNQVAQALHSAHMESQAKDKVSAAASGSEPVGGASSDPHGLDSLKGKVCPGCHSKMKAHMAAQTPDAAAGM